MSLGKFCFGWKACEFVNYACRSRSSFVNRIKGIYIYLEEEEMWGDVNEKEMKETQREERR